MEGIAASAATKVADSMVDKAMKEAHYLCCYKSYVEYFEEEKTNLSATRSKVLNEIEEAKNKNENQIEPHVQLWLDKADGLIQEDTKEKKRWFGLVTNCFWQYKRGKELEGKTQTTKQLIEQSNFPRVARSTGLPGIRFYSSPNFMHFEDRKLKFEQLKEALKDGNKFMIGLHGMGGTGKTTMAIEVGGEVEESKVFDKVIFSVVSKDANAKKIQANIAKFLGLPMEGGMDEYDGAKYLWKRIVEGGEKVLIILDDVWERLTLRDLGIPIGCHNKGCCTVLLTTRDWKVCREMECHATIKLEVLSDENAVDLFLSHAGRSNDDSSIEFKDVALEIVKECGRLPVAVIPVATTLNSKPLKNWKEALERLQSHEPMHDVDEDLKEAYNSLRLSIDNLKNERAKKLFLLCSLFPEDYEIPIELLSRIAIGLGLCGKVSRYSTARSHFSPIKDELEDSCLLKVEAEYVKMHDLIHEVARWIGNKQIQAVMDSNTTIMENVQYSSWNINDFPNHFHGSNLEVLLVWINENSSVKVPGAIFEKIENLKVLVLICWRSRLQISASSLLQPLKSLRNVHTLALHYFELGDISILGNLKGLETLELVFCSISELPDEVRELKKLRLLELRACSIERNNPFEVIGRCPQLEELYYVSNDIHEHVYEKHNQITTDLPELQRYHITMSDSYYDVDSSISRYFNSKRLKGVISEKTFLTSLVAGAEILELFGELDNETRWANIIPDMVPMEEGGMKDLTKLRLESCFEIKSLVNTEHLRRGVAILSKLVELQLYQVGVRELCWAHYPVDFLKQLEKLKLDGCLKLEGTLFKDKLDLSNLKYVYLYDCSMTCIFHPSTTQSLKQLKKLEIDKCSELKYIISWDKGSEEEVGDDHNTSQYSHDSMFRALNSFKVGNCEKLEFILPIYYCEDLPQLEIVEIWDCDKLKYIFGQYLEEEEEGGLHQMGKEIVLRSLTKVKILRVPDFISIYPERYLSQNAEAQQKWSPTTRDKDGTNAAEEISSRSRVSWGPLCCFGPKPRATSSINQPSVSEAAQPNPTALLGSKEKYVYNHPAQRFFTPPLYSSKLRELHIFNIGSNITSLFTLSIASSMSLLESLQVHRCSALQHIVTDVGDGDAHRKCSSIFPNLRMLIVSFCSLLECIFPASYSTTFEHLESIDILSAGELKYVFGNFHSEDDLSNYQNQNAQIQLDLPALERLRLGNVPKMVNICTGNYYVKALSLEDIWLRDCPQPPIKHLIDFSIGGYKRQEDLSRRKVIEKRLGNLKKFSVDTSDIDTIYDLKRLQIASPVNSSLESMTLSRLPELRDICVGPKNHLRFQDLAQLVIYECKQLRVIFSACIKRSLPKLRVLQVSLCEELMCIIEDDKKNDENPRDYHHACFPELRTIKVRRCKRLKSLFSISTCGGRLPQLLMLTIEDVPEMVQVFGWEQGATQKLEMKDVIPQLFVVELANLPSLQTICPAIDFHTVKIRLVRDCPNISLTSSAKNELFRGFASELERMIDSGDIDEIEDLIKGHLKMEEEEEEEEAAEEAWTSWEHNNNSPNVTNGEEPSKEIGERDSAIQKHTTSSPNLIESTKAAANEIAEGQFSISKTAATETPSFDSDVIRIKETGEASVEEIPKSDEAVLADEVNDLKLSNIPSPSSSPFQIKSPHREEFGKAAGEERTLLKQNNSSPNVANSEEASKEIGEKDSAIQKKSNSSKNLTEIIKERMDPSVQGGSEFEEAIRADQTMSSENEYPHDNLVHKEPKSERIILNQQDPPDTGPNMHSNDSQNVKNLHKTIRIGEEHFTDCPSSLQYTWEAPEEGVMKLNVAGAWGRVSNVAGCGGIFRNSKGECLGGFMQNIGKGSSFHAEVWACMVGLKFSWDLGIRKLVLETDAAEVIEAVRRGVGHDHPEREVLKEIQTMRDRDWEVRIMHCRREGNRASDILAKASLCCVQGFHPFKDKMPKELEKIALEEARVSSISTDVKPKTATSTIQTDPMSSQSRPSHISSNTTSLQEKSQGGILRALGESISSTESTERVDKELDNPQKVEELAHEYYSNERPHQTALATSPTIAEIKDSALVASSEGTSQLVSSISTCKESQQVTSDPPTDPKSSQSNSSDISSKTTSLQGQIIVNQTQAYNDSEIKDYINPQEIEKYELIRLLRRMKEDVDMEVDMPLIFETAAFEDDVAEAFADLESSLKMDLNQIAHSEEQTQRLENTLNFLSTHCSEDEPPTHGLRAKIDSLHQEIQSILSSFKQVSATLETYNELEEKEKLIEETHSQRLQAAFPLVSEILNTKKCMAELMKQISRLQTELNSKENEFKSYQNKLSSLKKKEKAIALDAIGFKEEYDAVKKDRSDMEDSQTEARKKLEKVENQWRSCVANVRNTALSLGILKQKL